MSDTGYESALMAAIDAIAGAVDALSTLADTQASELELLKADVARHHRAIDALTERLDATATLEDLRYLTRDVDALRTLMLERPRTPFDQDTQ